MATRGDLIKPRAGAAGIKSWIFFHNKRNTGSFSTKSKLFAGSFYVKKERWIFFHKKCAGSFSIKRKAFCVTWKLCFVIQQHCCRITVIQQHLVMFLLSLTCLLKPRFFENKSIQKVEWRHSEILSSSGAPHWIFLARCPRNMQILAYTQENLFDVLLKQTEIRLYLPCTDWFGTKRTSVWFQINRKMVNTIWFWFDPIRFCKDISVSEKKTS